MHLVIFTEKTLMQNFIFCAVSVRYILRDLHNIIFWLLLKVEKNIA